MNFLLNFAGKMFVGWRILEHILDADARMRKAERDKAEAIRAERNRKIYAARRAARIKFEYDLKTATWNSWKWPDEVA